MLVSLGASAAGCTCIDTADGPSSSIGSTAGSSIEVDEALELPLGTGNKFARFDPIEEPGRAEFDDDELEPYPDDELNDEPEPDDKPRASLALKVAC